MDGCFVPHSERCLLFLLPEHFAEHPCKEAIRACLYVVHAFFLGYFYVFDDDYDFVNGNDYDYDSDLANAHDNDNNTDTDINTSNDRTRHQWG